MTTTSDSSKGGAEPSANRQASQAAAAAGLPHPAILERLANDFFRGNPPANMPVETLTLSTIPFSAATVPTEPVITEAQLRAIPATLTDAPMTTPGIPGGYSATDLMPSANLSFLTDARSIYASTAAVAVQAAPAMDTLKIPYETNLGDLEMSFNGVKAPPIPVSPIDVSAPHIPGMTDLQKYVGDFPKFDFLQIANPLEPKTAPLSIDKIASDPTTSKLAGGLSSVPFDVNAIRRDFPILNEKINGRQLVWLDNAATTHKPQSVIDRLSFFYAHENSNIHRAAHTLAARATDAYEAAREKVRRFLNASSANEIIFVRGATEAINLVAQSWGRRNIQKDDEIVITWLEHHANIVPWQMLCAEKGAKLRVAPVDNSGQILLEEYEKLLNSRTRLVAFAHVSNALGTIVPVEEMIAAAHRRGAKVLVDGAQAVSHLRVDVQAYDCDFYVFSGHKVFAPTGIGVVYGKADVLETTPPWQGGGNMITDVTFEKTQYQTPPGRFEAGTGSIGDAVGLGAAIDYVERIGMANIARYEHDLLLYAIDALQRIPGLHLIGTAKEKASVLSFVLDGFRTEDVGAALNQEGIAVRSGHHCAQPILRRFGVESTVRPSLALYNTCEDVDALVNAIWNLKSGRNPGLP
jgi:cysteine desulfurase / selenocysteine lyase